MTLTGSGTIPQPITLGAYGTGSNPKILRNQATDDICVLLIDLWPVLTQRQLIAGTDQTGYASDVSSVSVRAGDMIRFQVSANGENLYDTVSWTPSIAYVSAPRPIARAPHKIVGILPQDPTTERFRQTYPGDRLNVPTSGCRLNGMTKGW